MKHEQLAKRMLSELQEPWMDNQDKADFDADVSHAAMNGRASRLS